MKKKFILLMMLLTFIGGVNLNSLRAQETITIGSGTEVQAFIPLNTNYDNTISEQIFLAEDFQDKTGSITSYAFKSAKDLQSYSTPITVTRNFKIYMMNTDKASFVSTTDWVNMTDANLVFNGSVTVQPKDTWTTITFDTPFNYETGKNVILCIHAEGSWNNAVGNFYKHNTTDVRSLVYYNDGEVFDATNITVTSKFDNLNHVAQAQFTFADGGTDPVEPTAPATPANLLATATGETTIDLSWNAVNGATSYNVYCGTNAVATALTATTYTVENLTAGTEYCYNVTAVNEAGESAATADACATTDTAETPDPTPDPEEGFLVIGDVNTTESTSVAPFKNANSYTWVETFYPKEEIGQAMTITSLAYKCATYDLGSGYTFSADEIEIYIGETEHTNHSSSAVWVPQDELTLVYSGTNVLLGEEEWETLVLDTPYEYSGTRNLAIAVSKSSTAYNSAMKWASTTVSKANNYRSSDTNASYADYPAGNGSTNGSRPIIKIGYSSSVVPEAPATPADFTATAAGETTIILTWEAVEGATSYNIYCGTEAFATDVTETTYNATGLTTGTEYCFNVTAVNIGGESAPTADACATPTAAQQGDYALYEDFNDGSLDGWRLIDADGDGLNWKISSGNGGIMGVNDTKCIYSESWVNGNGINPDNYIVTTTAYTITEGSKLEWDVLPTNNNYYEEHYGIVYSTDGQYFTTIWEETLTSTIEYLHKTLELDYLVGQTVYIGFRHYMCSDNEAICIDNIALSLGDGGNEEQESDLAPVAQVTATENGANVDVAWSMESTKTIAHVNQETGKIEYYKNTKDSRDASDYTFHSYKVYRANGDNDPVVLAENLTETTYQDATWAEAESGVYKWGVAAMYTANNNAKGTREEVTLINEGFEVGYFVLPEGWTTYSDPSTANQYGNFNAYPTLYTDVSAFAGAYSAFTLGGYAEAGSIFYLVTPAIDLTSIVNTTLNFYYVCPEFWGSVNTLSVKYSTSPTGPWTDLWTANTTTSWLESTIDLSECSGNTIYIAFCTVEGGGWGVGVDNVVIKGTQSDGPIPVASEIVWSNTIDKDMTTTVAVNVATNDGGSVAGTTVTLANINEPSYVYETTLDATGHYEWTEFRKGTYEVTIELEGYNSCADGEIMEIMDATTIECTMEVKPEILDGLYVSPTGWAMWEYVAPDFTGETFEFDFEDGTLMGWTTIDADGDSYSWSSNAPYEGAIVGHESDYCVFSQSYDNISGPLTPDNYIVSPEKYAIIDGSEFSFYVSAQDANYAAEHFGVAISTTGNTSAADFTTIYEGTLTAKSNGTKGPRDGGKDIGTWYRHTVDLSAYAGQEVYIALRHFNCTDMFYILADDFKLGGRTAPNIYDVLLDGETVADDIAESFYQLDVTALTEGQQYTTTIVVNNVTTQVLEYTWTYRACSNYTGVTNLTATGDVNGNAVVTWTLPVYENQDPVYAFASNFDDGSLNGWKTIDADGDARNWRNTSEHANQGFGVNNTYCASSLSYDNEVGALTPDNYLVTDVKYTITEGTKLTYSVCGQSNTWFEEHYGVAISTTNSTDASAFTTIFEETLERGNVDEGSIQTQWFEREIDLSDYAGQAIYIAFRHFNCTNQFWINIDNVELTSTRAASEEDDEWIFYDNGTYESAFGVLDYNTMEPQTMYWAIMFPAEVISQYAGKELTKISLYNFEAHEGAFSIHIGGDTAPGTMVHVQEYNATATTGEFVEFELTTPITISGTENVWIQCSNTTGYMVAAHSADCGEPNGRWMSYDGSSWFDTSWFGEGWYGTWMLRAFLEGESTPIDPNPQDPEIVDAEVLGVMLYRDGELITEEPLNAETYSDSGLATGEHSYEVRVVYGGEDPATYYAMSCAEEATVTIPLNCIAPEKLYGEATFNNENSFGATLRWPYSGSVSEWLYYDDGSNLDGIGGPESFYWGIKFPAESLASYAGTFLTKVAMFDRAATTSTLQIYYGGENAPEMLVHTQEFICTGSNDFTEYDLTSALPIDPTQSIWVVMYTTQGSLYPASCCANTGDANGRWISMDGAEWMDVLTGAGLDVTWMIRAYASSDAKGNVSELKPIVVENNNAVNTDAKFVAQNGNKGNAFDHYNVYRKTANNNYELIAETTSGYYFDEINVPGTYYYQVTAVYKENGLECESEPATAYGNEDEDFVIVNVTSINENGVKGMMVYPNPTKDNINITAENMTRITVTNALGQVMYDTEVTSDNKVINMAQYEAGVYMVRITTENGVAVERITVVK